MDETDFEALAERALARLEAALEASGVDADVERKDGGVLEIEFADGSKMIVNRHGAAREIWVAARAASKNGRWPAARAPRMARSIISATSRLSRMNWLASGPIFTECGATLSEA